MSCISFSLFLQPNRVQKAAAAAAEMSLAGSGVGANWLSNLLPTGKEENMSEPSSTEATPSVTPTHQPNPIQGSFGSQKPVNLLSESGPQPGRKLSEKEQRDCEVIGIFFFLSTAN